MAKQKGWQKTLGKITGANRSLDRKMFQVKKNLDEVNKLLGKDKK